MIRRQFGPDDWDLKARQELEAARALAKVSLWQQAFHRAGFALECALKYRIMRVRRMNRWPERQDARELYTHDIVALLLQSGLFEQALGDSYAASPRGIAWSIAKDWSNDIRYDPRPFPRQRAVDMLWAVDDMELVLWLLNA